MANARGLNVANYAGLGARATFAPTGEWKRDPRVLARLGWGRLRRGQAENLETLAPFYGQ